VSLRERERKRKKPFQDTSLPHLLSLFLALSILALLVGKSVTTPALFSNSSNNTNIKRNPKNSKSRKRN
jgi:hypothetical protein